jgi:hypothetical protein
MSTSVISGTWRAALPLPACRSTADIRRNDGYVSCGRVEDRRGSWGQWRSPRFPSPLIEPDVRRYPIRLSDWLHQSFEISSPKEAGCLASPSRSRFSHSEGALPVNLRRFGWEPRRAGFIPIRIFYRLAGILRDVACSR